jgi:hypothetical protein
VHAVGVAGLTTFDEYRDPKRKRAQPQPINAVMVSCWEGDEYTPGEEKVFLTSLSVHTPREVIDRYDLRGLIENCGNRDLKQGWLINKYPKKRVDAIRAHVYLTAAKGGIQHDPCLPQQRRGGNRRGMHSPLPPQDHGPGPTQMHDPAFGGTTTPSSTWKS